MTRFLLLATEACQNGGQKTSIVFATPHEAGRLFAVLKHFAEADINLTRIASMPLRSDPNNYCFFLDFEGAASDPKVAEVLEKMKTLTISMKFLGSYPADIPE
jgi:prephenate dehydratase